MRSLQFKLLGLPRDEFPTFPSVRFNDSWRVKSGELQKLISHTAFAVSNEESRPILNGVLWELREERMRMVATNGHRLAKMELPVEASSAPPGDLIVPPRPWSRSAVFSRQKRSWRSHAAITTWASVRRSLPSSPASSKGRIPTTSK